MNYKVKKIQTTNDHNKYILDQYKRNLLTKRLEYIVLLNFNMQNILEKYGAFCIYVWNRETTYKCQKILGTEKYGKLQAIHQSVGTLRGVIDISSTYKDPNNEGKSLLWKSICEGQNELQEGQNRRSSIQYKLCRSYV